MKSEISRSSSFFNSSGYSLRKEEEVENGFLLDLILSLFTSFVHVVENTVPWPGKPHVPLWGDLADVTMTSVLKRRNIILVRSVNTADQF